MRPHPPPYPRPSIISQEGLTSDRLRPQQRTEVTTWSWKILVFKLRTQLSKWRQLLRTLGHSQRLPRSTALAASTPQLHKVVQFSCVPKMGPRVRAFQLFAAPFHQDQVEHVATFELRAVHGMDDWLPLFWGKLYFAQVSEALESLKGLWNNLDSAESALYK